ncbi:MAG TPA: hypothetical protein VEA63_15725 [Opitutus sp.]|nr:hypothetical protein [Opitutus sp.]
MSLKSASGKAYGQDMRVVPEQEHVTHARLVPAMPAILERLRVHRESVDREAEQCRDADARNAASDKIGPPLKTYPIGFCRHIRDLVWARAIADPAFRKLIGEGVLVRRVFIFLKGQYFQNAVQLGNLYVDVANDTVWVDKPKLEWMPVADVPYENVERWATFADVASRYLKVELYPNFLFPGAFPVSPFFAIRRNGRLDLLFAQDALFLKDLGEGMPRIQALLADEALMSRRLPAVYEELLWKKFAGGAPAGFPLTFAPSGMEAIRGGIVREFVELANQPPEPGLPAVDGYLRKVMQATRTLSEMDLVPSAAELARLRADGAIPAAA